MKQERIIELLKALQNLNNLIIWVRTRRPIMSEKS